MLPKAKHEVISVKHQVIVLWMVGTALADLTEPSQRGAERTGRSLGQRKHRPQPALRASSTCEIEICTVADGTLLNILDAHDPSGHWECS